MASTISPVVPARGQSELAMLGRGFNDMLGSVRKLLASREQLLNDVSHELRTPLTRMRLTLEMMPESKHKESLLEDIGQMSHMTKMILDYASLDGSRGLVEKRLFNLSQIIRQVCHGAREQVDFNEIPDKIMVIGDPMRSSLVLGNVVSNALKFGKESGRKAVIRANISCPSQTYSARHMN